MKEKVWEIKWYKPMTIKVMAKTKKEALELYGKADAEIGEEVVEVRKIRDCGTH